MSAPVTATEIRAMQVAYARSSEDRLRACIEAAAQSLIDLLDQLDAPTTDLEPDADLEDSADREPDGEDEPDAEYVTETERLWAGGRRA